MKRLLRILQHIDSAVEYSGRIIVVGTLFGMFWALFINVLLRYILGSGIAWAYEIHNIFFPWLVAGGAVLASLKGRNIVVHFLFNYLPAPIQRITQFLTHVFIAILCLGIVYTSQPILKAAEFSRLAETGISQKYGYWSLVYAFVAIALIALMQAIRNALGTEAQRLEAQELSFS